MPEAGTERPESAGEKRHGTAIPYSALPIPNLPDRPEEKKAMTISSGLNSSKGLLVFGLGR